MPVCAQCSGVNPDGDRFCSDCGAPLGTSCPGCGSTVAAGKRFCGQCGTAVVAAGDGQSQPVPATVTTAPVAERRVCSVLFCDLVGFTPLSEARDPEEVRDLLSRYFDIARTVISRYGGTVEKFIGDAVMAVWGTPVALEGDTERAVRAALDLVDDVTALGLETGTPSLAARAGVVTGEVAVTLGATNQGMVAGDIVNTAARVQSTAAPQSVLVDETTRRLAQAAVAFEDGGEHQLKGKAEAQKLWRAMRVLSGVGGVQRVDGLEAPLTGRDIELRLIKDQFHASVDRRTPRLVVVSGPAGVGKSRLGWEFEKYVDGLAMVTLWHRGRCLSYGDGVVFWALAEIVRQRLGIAEEDPLDTAAEKLAAGVAANLSDHEEQEYVGVRLGRLLGVSYPGDSGRDLAREELFAGWRLWFERLAASHPVVLLVEDAHYADSGLLEFLDHLVDWARDVPVFILVFSRPELEVSHPRWGTGRNRMLLALDPLDTASMNTLLDALVPDIPPAAASAIAKQAQGIPLFAVETVRSLIDQDVVVPQDGVYRLVAEVGELSVPDSLHALLAARLDALTQSVRGLVADAAVLGSTFPAEALVAVSERSDPDVHEALDELVRREVLEISADPLSPQRGTYHFSHEMLRQVAYDTLSRRDRKARHLTVAAHLRSAFPGDGDEVVDVIARHYLDALNAMPGDPDAEQIRAEAVAALTRAGERGERTGSPRRAAVSYITASDLLESTADDADTLPAARLAERAAAAAFGGAQYTEAVEYVDRAHHAYLHAGETRDAGRALILSGRALRVWGRHAEARERLLGAIDLLGEEPNKTRALAVDQLAALEVFAGTPQAAELTDQSIQLIQTVTNDPTAIAGPLTTRGIWLNSVGRRAEAVALLREAARLSEQAGDNIGHGIALLNLSDVLGTFDAAGAAEAARASADELRRNGYRSYLSYALMNLAYALLVSGEWDEAEHALTVTAESDGIDQIDEIVSDLAWVVALRGDADRATALLSQLTDLRQTEAPQEQAFISLVEACIATASNDPAEALRLAQATLEHAGALGIGAEQPRWAWPIAARCAHYLGDIATEQELLSLLDAQPDGHLPPMLLAERELVTARLTAAAHDPAAAQQFPRAIAALRERSSPYHLGEGLLDYAEYLAAIGQAASSAALIDEAQQIAARLGSRPLAARAEDVQSGLDRPRIPGQSSTQPAAL
jgi:class 3 adenylate cyclase/tetratricopeptide (TPR) repeat protein